MASDWIQIPGIGSDKVDPISISYIFSLLFIEIA